MWYRLIIVVALHSVSLAAQAAQVLRLEVEQNADVYEVRVEMHVEAPAENVRAILTDFTNLGRLNESITESRVLPSEHHGVVRVMTRTKNCVLFFCMDLRKVEDVTEDEQGRLLVTIVPDSSSFRSGHSTWQVLSTSGGSRVIHYARIEPDVLIPPLLGTTVLKRALRREILRSFSNLDCLARSQCETGGDAVRQLQNQDVAYSM